MTIQQQRINTANLKDAIVWDVREPKAYNDGHLAGAINMPLSKLSAESLQNVPAESPIFVLCGGGTRAGKAIELLEAIDSTRVYIELKGGTRAAKTAGLPIMVTRPFVESLYD